MQNLVVKSLVGFTIITIAIVDVIVITAITATVMTYFTGEACCCTKAFKLVQD